MRIALLSGLVAAPVLPAAAQAQNPGLGERVLNIAHQGGEDEFPSNTRYAFERSVKAGAEMLELDVGVTRDGNVVVSHDTTLDRTTNGRGTIASHTLAQIRRLDGAYVLGAQTISVTNAENVARAHRDGYARLSDDGESTATWRQLIDWCVDGVMTARPIAFETVLRGHPAPGVCG